MKTHTAPVAASAIPSSYRHFSKALSARVWPPRLVIGDTLTPGAHKLHDRECRERSPVEEAEGNAGLCALAEVVAIAIGHADEGGHGDRAGEPEEAREGEQGESDDRDVQAREDDGRQGDVGEDEDRPDGGEEHEGELGGRAAPPGAVSLTDDWECSVSRVLPMGASLREGAYRSLSGRAL